MSDRLRDLQEDWGDLRQQLEERGVKLAELHGLFRVYEDMEEAIVFIENTSRALVSAPVGKDVDEVVELKERHTNVKTDIDAMATSACGQLEAAVKRFKASGHSKVDLVADKHRELLQAFESLRGQAAERDELLERSLAVCSFFQVRVFCVCVWGGGVGGT